MLLVGLTGGIGSGKSTLAALLEERGAHVIDVDALGHEALEPGQPAWRSVVESFGNEVLAAASISIDRKRLARIVFEDPTKLSLLNAITHPVILRKIADALEPLRGTDEIVILDAALIVEMGLGDSLDVIVVVTSTEEARRLRLMQQRGMTRAAVDARIAAQALPEQLLEQADVVVVNDGTLEALARDADRVWEELQARNA